MGLNKILFFVPAVALINIGVHFASPSPAFVFSLSDFSLQNMLLYQFTHFSLSHLIENLLSLVFTGALAMELEMKPEDFMLAYFAGVFIAVPLLIFAPGAYIAGNSTGIFGALAASLMKARKLISVYITYTFATLFIFSLSLTSFLLGNTGTTVLKSDLFHFFGFGAGATTSISRYKNNLFAGGFDVGKAVNRRARA